MQGFSRGLNTQSEPRQEQVICREIVCYILDESRDPLEGKLASETNREELEIFHVGSDI